MGNCFALFPLSFFLNVEIYQQFAFFSKYKILEKFKNERKILTFQFVILKFRKIKKKFKKTYSFTTSYSNYDQCLHIFFFIKTKQVHCLIY